MKVKQNLAAAYQIIAKLGMDDHTYTHLSARPKDADYFYIYRLGLRFEEVKADELLKVSLDGEVLEGIEEHRETTGYVIHSSIYKARPDLNAIFHLHTVPTVAVSAMKEGLMPISQWALHFYGQIAYHNYDSLVLDPNIQGKNMASDLSDKNVMLLRNHGMITCGKTIYEAMFYCYHLELACKAQLAALSSGAELIMPPPELCKKTNDDLLGFEKELGLRDWQAWLRFLEEK